MKSAASQANTDTTPEVNTSYVPYSGRPYIITEKKDYKTPLLFLLSYSLWGLQFYPALIFMIIIMIRAYRDNKYNFVLMFTIFAGSYGFAKESMIPVRFADVALLAS
ncbi:MAG: hypothetical protein K2F79_04920, partial [Muribaculaceae bacterium]|nr:hypothetical protein [Muribaculaceae bacterium]